MSKISVIVGGQFGSEAKGHVTRQVIDRYLDLDPYRSNRVLNVRVAGPNAGHCAYDDEGNRWALRQVPVGVTNPDTRISLHIAPGSEIDMDVLIQEITALDASGLNASGRLTVSPEATLLTAEHKYREGAAQMHEKIGSTGKGIGAARADRLMRTAKRLGDDADAVRTLRSLGVGIQEMHSTWVYNLGLDTHIVIEGTQGYGLGLHAGHYPQCTSSDTRAIDFLAMAGVNPWAQAVRSFEVWVVARVYPIRVAGNSGALLGETTWEDLGLPPEHTTVTHKVRRVGQWDPHLIRSAVQANGGEPVVRLALTMVDQKFGWIEGKSDEADLGLITREASEQYEDFLAEVEADAGAAVRMVTTSPTTAIWRDPILVPSQKGL